jgi:hypothetical protein
VEWIDEIEGALETCHALAAYLTADFPGSKWTDQEIGFCVKRRVLIVPVRIDINPYGFASRYQALPGKGRTPEVLAHGIFDTLVAHDLTSAQMASAVVSRFEGSRSYDSARANSKLLADVKTWTPDLLRRLEGAADKNSEIANAWGVSSRVEAIIRGKGA